MPWERHTRLFGHEVAVRVVLIAMVAAGYVLGGRGDVPGRGARMISVLRDC